MFKTLQTGLPPYIAEQLYPYAPTRAMRSSASNLLHHLKFIFFILALQFT